MNNCLEKDVEPDEASTKAVMHCMIGPEFAIKSEFVTRLGSCQHSTDSRDVKNTKYDCLGRDIYICEHCESVFKKKEDLENHMVKRFGLYYCEKCCMSFCNEHQKSHVCVNEYPIVITGKVLGWPKKSRKCICDVCSEDFSTKNSVKRRKNDKQHECQLCQKKFTWASILKNHMLLHENKRGFKCQLCPKSYNCSSYLKIHMISHGNQRQHKCQLCQKCFTRRSSLKAHLLTHENNRLYKCQLCQKSFNLSSTLRSHMQSHENKGQHKCQLCQKLFNRPSRLKRHMLSHEKHQ